MNKHRLPKSELEMCARFHFARDRILKITQAACAAEIGVERGVVVNYEIGRTALRYDVALRFCRQFIISEEWLATGRHDLFHAGIGGYGVGLTEAGQNWTAFDQLISIRQAVDLLSEPMVLHIKQGTLFSEAFERSLKSRYAELVSEFWFSPRIQLTDADKPELGIRFLEAVHDRHMKLLLGEAGPRPAKSGELWRHYARHVFECSTLVFRKLRGSRLTADELRDLDWLRTPVTDTATLPGPTPAGPVSNTVAGDTGSVLTKAESRVGSGGGDMKSLLPSLLARLNQAASAPGKKSELAKYLGVPLASVSRWLSGDREPGGEITLKLFHWLGQEEREK